ncbi:MAG: aspartate--tRNA ligase [Deltaproteobacteria bacterium]|nr:aspartate--tRNA ligase [Deltaproteobacteria bacterium]
MDLLHRTHTCGNLRGPDAGKTVVLTGWVETKRDLGGFVFVDLRDRHGVTQVTFDPTGGNVLFTTAQDLRPESVIGVEGVVASRGRNTNKELPTGEIEVRATRVEVFSRADTPPFTVTDETTANEDLRLKYRYLDLRRRPIAKNIVLRHRIAKAARDYFDRQGFLEIETPFLTRSTPEGARDYLVPSRVNPGRFYALPQSPQLFKQLLMVAGMDRYFQIVRCFRDEDLRADRQPEFTQIDVEMSFADVDSIAGLIEGLLQQLFREVSGVEIPAPFRRLTWDEAVRDYGTDKPDLRFDLRLVDLTVPVRTRDGGGVGLFRKAVEAGGIVKALAVRAPNTLTRTDIDKLEDQVKQLGSKGLARAKIEAPGQWTLAPWAKDMDPHLKAEIEHLCAVNPGDVILLQFGRARDVNLHLASLRQTLARKFGMVKPGEHAFAWITDFPLLEYSEEEQRYVACHHPFTSPRPVDVEKLENAPGAVKAQAYDIVLNGFELGGGSIRIHDRDLQSRVFTALGIGEAEAQSKFGFLLEAFRYGAPPHGGIALGLDRLAMLMAGADSLRDVVAFPKTARAVDLMTEAPAGVDERQLEELRIRLKA